MRLRRTRVGAATANSGGCGYGELGWVRLRRTRVGAATAEAMRLCGFADKDIIHYERGALDIGGEDPSEGGDVLNRARVNENMPDEDDPPL